jgi:hypothetical protein
MAQINWRERFIAAAIHFGVTALVSGAAALVIFLLWFPSGLSRVVGGTNLFFIVSGCDVVLGPLMSLVIYNSTKPRRELLLDYAIIGALQLAALAYGVFVIAASRPVFIAFDIDRIEIVTAIELEEKNLAAGNGDFNREPWFGPRLAAIRRPTQQEERNDLLFLEVTAGKGAYLMPKYYRPYDEARRTIRAKYMPIETLLKNSGAAEPIIEQAIAKTGGDPGRLRWLLAHHRFGFCVALLDEQTAEPIAFVGVNPTWVK